MITLALQITVVQKQEMLSRGTPGLKATKVVPKINCTDITPKENLRHPFVLRLLLRVQGPSPFRTIRKGPCRSDKKEIFFRFSSPKEDGNGTKVVSISTFFQLLRGRNKRNSYEDMRMD
ncbi:hypothetical protein TNCV_3479911 [Trichonephila clavipes]|nr:hypothetical protein TNCV_3479911 [Trichonephila clavipes]